MRLHLVGLEDAAAAHPVAIEQQIQHVEAIHANKQAKQWLGQVTRVNPTQTLQNQVANADFMLLAQNAGIVQTGDAPDAIANHQIFRKEIFWGKKD
jgi:hypothetical protein